MSVTYCVGACGYDAAATAATDCILDRGVSFTREAPVHRILAVANVLGY